MLCLEETSLGKLKFSENFRTCQVKLQGKKLPGSPRAAIWQTERGDQWVGTVLSHVAEKLDNDTEGES